MTKKEALVVTAYTGILVVNSFPEFHRFAEDVLGRPIQTAEFADTDLLNELKGAVSKEFFEITHSLCDTEDMTAYYSDMIAAFSADFELAREGEHSLSDLQGKISNGDYLLGVDINKLSELDFRIRQGTLKIVSDKSRLNKLIEED